MANMETLFPILGQPRVNGLGRMALESEHLDAGHDVDFRSLAVRSILNKSVSKRLHWMVWSINPYRGCEFGCRYCYARYTHEFLAPAAGEPLRGTLADADRSAIACSTLSSFPLPLSSCSGAEGSACEPEAQIITGTSQPAGPSAALREDTGKVMEDKREVGDDKREVCNGIGSDEAGLNSREETKEVAVRWDNAETWNLRDPEAFERRIFVKSNAA